MNHRRSDDLGESERLQIRKWLDCCLYFAALSPDLPPPASVAPFQNYTKYKWVVSSNENVNYGRFIQIL